MIKYNYEEQKRALDKQLASTTKWVELEEQTYVCLKDYNKTITKRIEKHLLEHLDCDRVSYYSEKDNVSQSKYAMVYYTINGEKMSHKINLETISYNVWYKAQTLQDNLKEIKDRTTYQRDERITSMIMTLEVLEDKINEFNEIMGQLEDLYATSDDLKYMLKVKEY